MLVILNLYFANLQIAAVWYQMLDYRRRADLIEWADRETVGVEIRYPSRSDYLARWVLIAMCCKLYHRGFEAMNHLQ